MFQSTKHAKSSLNRPTPPKHFGQLVIRHETLRPVTPKRTKSLQALLAEVDALCGISREPEVAA